MAKHWYILKSKPLCEDRVDGLLKQGGFETYLPKLRQPQKTSTGQRSLRLKPLFPCYIFVRGELESADIFHKIRYTRGVSHILCASNSPVRVAPEIIRTIKEKTGGRGYITNPTEIRSGDTIKVKSGILVDLQGVLLKPCSDEERVVVLLKTMSQSVKNFKATLHWSEIEKIAA